MEGLSRDELEKLAVTLEEEMLVAAEELRFEYAAKLRDEIKELRRELRRPRPPRPSGPNDEGPGSLPALRLRASVSRPYGSRVMRSRGVGAIGECASRYAENASVSTSPPSRFVPSRRTENPSPPSARNELTVTR